jgi:hypothetical protein
MTSTKTSLAKDNSSQPIDKTELKRQFIFYLIGD